ncbi:Zn finger-containing GTPase- Activating Protein for ARF [Saxophila tyrrhenica]|uniref:Zn finger-containing GTPase- Activating Protein for ARF n=1 Tax=Saxophila tyrrhenica TaxID=1690608 RepID=A0AAV9PNB8_9PEZI|nr:Zn finger-containing GTPase- Activating Protein for ARF [Saxophila tyrrhenica]
MDAFKTAEVKRMEYGGNKPWKEFFNAHSSNKLLGRDFDSCTISERYDSEAGEEWKDRLTSKVEGTEYVPGTSKRKEPVAKKATVESAGPTPSGSGRNTPMGNVRSPPPQRTASPSQKSRNEAYFASKGSENASRPEGLPPSQGGKYGGFGSGPPPTASSSNGGFQDDPVAALTKGFGWLSSNLTKQAATINSTYLQPGLQNLAQQDFAAQARQTALQAGTFVQQGAKGVGDQFNKFVDPDMPQSGQQSGGAPRRAEPAQKDFWDSFGQPPAGPPKEKQSFWDDFAAAGEQKQVQAQPKPSSIGTSAMKTTTGTGAGGAGAKKDDDEWGAW